MRLRTIVGALAFGALIVAPGAAEASSHREAPFISKNPKVDGTDFYMFESYETGRAGFVTILANYQPLQDAYGGPNYFGLDPNALYEIEIDNNGDAVEDLTFQFQFQQALGGSGGAGFALMIGPDGGQKSVAVPFYNVGLIPNAAGTGNSAALNVNETFTVDLVKGPRRGSAGTAIMNGASATFVKPADNIGSKSFGTAASLDCKQGVGACINPAATDDYAAYASHFIYTVTIPGCSAADANTARIFVGQRAESFAVNLGVTFDLIDAPAAIVTGGGVAANYNAVPNPIGAKNVTTIALELPRDCITQSATQPVIGAWTTASVRQARVINPAATYVEPSHEGGAWTQVSRLSNPLVNELVIGLPDKDKFNSSEPVDDVMNFGTYVEYPTLPAVIDKVFGVTLSPTVFPRVDLVAAFLTGFDVVPGTPFNAFPSVDGGTKPITAEYIRLNTNTETLTGVAVTAAGSQNRLGAALCVVKGVITPGNAGCDPHGFPNGRRPIDDVVDLALDVVEGYLLPSGAPAYAGAGTFFTDGVDQAIGGASGGVGGGSLATPFQNAFPYLATPTQGANGNGT
jgi:hypothetical protein